MIPVSKAFYDALNRGEMPEILCILDSNVSRWVFGKVRPSIATSTANVWDGARLYGQGTYGGDLGLILADAGVLTFGSISASIAYSNKDVMMSLTQVEIGSMQLVLDNAGRFFSDLLGGDKAVSFLNSTLQITCGFPTTEYADYIELFSGTVTEETLDNKSLKVCAQSSTPGLMEVYTLPKSGRYTNPQTNNDILPVVYGNTEEGSTQGISVCPCIDTVNFVYCLASHALPVGANIMLYEDNEALVGGYTITRSGDYESQGIIAYATYTTAPTGVITMTTTAGKDSLTNPVDILHDMLDSSGDTTAHNSAAWTRAAQEAEALSYAAAGVLSSDNTPAYWMTDILSSFLGSWYINNNREVVISFDSTRLQTSAIAGVLHERDASKITGQRTRANLCNQLAVNYAYSLADLDARFKQKSNPKYLQYEDGATTADTTSQAKYGSLLKTLEINWCRALATVTALQTRVIERYKDPVFVVTFPEQTFKNVCVEPGDFILYSFEDQEDIDGDPVKNQIARVLSIERDLDALTCSFKLIDFGLWLTTDPYLWDGTHVYGTIGETYGSNRDRREV